MQHLRFRPAIVAVAALLALGTALPVFAAEAPPNHPLTLQAQGQEHGPTTQDANGREVEPMLIWSAVAVAACAVAGAALYLLKRQLGGFPANPSWVAPISIMPSSTFPDESTYGNGAGDAHHAPAHH